MTREEVEGFLDIVEGYYDRKYSKGVRSAMVNSLISEPIGAAKKALSWLEEHHAEYRPSPLQLEKVVRDMAASERERDAEKRRQEERKPESFLNQEQRSQHAKESCRFIRAIQTGEMSREKIIEGFLVMENRYPGVGWAESCSQLKKNYDRNKHG